MKYKLLMSAVLISSLVLGVFVWEHQPNALSLAEERFVGTWDLLPASTSSNSKKLTFKRDRTLSSADKVARESRWSVSNGMLRIHNDYKRTLFQRVPFGRHTETFSFTIDFTVNNSRVNLKCVELPLTMVLVQNSREHTAGESR